MKFFLKTIYIIDSIILYFILLIFLLWSTFHIITHFPPKIEAIIIFFFVVFSFIGFIKILLKKAKNYHLLESIVLPTALIMSFLYFILPMVVKAIPIIENEQAKNASLAIDINLMMTTLELVQVELKEMTFFNQLSILFSFESQPFMIIVIIVLIINFIGNYKIYLTSLEPTLNTSKKGLL